MVTVGLLDWVEAKLGRAADVESFLRGACRSSNAEPATTAWFANCPGESTFDIFDVFPDESGRETHLSGRDGAALEAKLPGLLRASGRLLEARRHCA